MRRRTLPLTTAGTRPRHRLRSLGTSLGIATIAAAVLIGTMAYHAPRGSDGTLDIARLLEAPRAYEGERVTLRGEFGDLMSDNAFVLEDHTVLAKDEVVVINASGEPLRIWDSEDLAVTGVVKVFHAAEVEGDIGTELDDEVWASLEGRPVIFAESVTHEDRGAALPAIGR